ncbi:cupin domain-containing protein [Sulfurovum sp. XGS-02]|uniref:cupin domain-containing protein n=1 Tax=Sulfurovum sp. XGS-02 TaxID=2925411 RepID=UPI00206EDB87|nr:cupin domain-containing protein [Sulfurovum sp. XGS-02]UPT77744.1 cupin domain-containing protein [Sulfurovum sp. XGS-02]
MNIYDTITPESGETFTPLLTHKNIKINRIISSDQLDDTEYIQEEDEWLVLLEGEATLHLNQVEYLLTKGDTLFIPAKIPHRVLHTQNGTIWLTVHIF